MHWCLKFLWVTSVFAIIFFTFLAIILSRQPQFLPFKPNNIQHTIHECVIVLAIYVVIFIVTSGIWWRNLLYKRRMEYAGMIEEEIRQVHIH